MTDGRGAGQLVGDAPQPVPRDGLTVWFTGLPSSGKTTVARHLGQRLAAAGRPVELLDGDAVRAHLSSRLGFSRSDRDENVGRVGFIAHLLSRNGVTVLCSLVSPYRAARDAVRSLHQAPFLEVHVAAPLEECVRRDVKGLYARQRAGEVHHLTGVDDPYEPPLAPDLVLPTHLQTVEQSVAEVWRLVADARRSDARV